MADHYSEVSTFTALLRGMMCRCPNCGIGKIFKKFTTVNESCASCGEDFSHQRADDAPPYIVIVLVGHIIVPLALVVEKTFEPSILVHMALWLPLTVVSSILLLPPAKGFVIAIQWLNGMHGFRQRS